MPKNNLDLYSKVSINQGVMAFWRGNGALMSKLTVQYSVRFVSYDLIKSTTDSKLLAALLSACLTTTASYPLDLAYCLMASDMSKKPALHSTRDKQGNKVKKYSSDKLYTSTRDTMYKLRTRDEGGLMKGYRVALLS